MIYLEKNINIKIKELCQQVCDVELPRRKDFNETKICVKTQHSIYQLMYKMFHLQVVFIWSTVSKLEFKS